jgi:hypothetical protein
VTGAVDVGVMSGVGRVLDVGSCDGDTTLALFRCLVDGAILEELCVALLGLSLGDGGCEGGLCQLVSMVRGMRRQKAVLYLSVIDVTDGSCIYLARAF